MFFVSRNVKNKARKTHGKRPIFWLQVAFGASVVVPIVFASGGGLIAYEQSKVSIDVKLEQAVDAAYQVILKVIDLQKVIMSVSKSDIEYSQNFPVDIRQELVMRRLEVLAENCPSIAALRIFNNEGKMLLGTGERDDLEMDKNIPTNEDLTTKPIHFKHLVEPNVIYFSQRVINRTDTENDDQIIVISVKLDYFNNFIKGVLANYSVDKGEAISLRRKSGTMIMRFPSVNPHFVPPENFQNAIQINDKHGRYFVHNTYDGLDKMITYRQIENFDLYVVAAIPLPDGITQLFVFFMPYMIIGVPAMIALIVLSGTALKHAKLAENERDVREKIEFSLQESQKYELLSRLTGGIAHDFNNLFAIISLSIELTKRKLPPDSTKNLDQTFIAVEKGSFLVKQLLTFSRNQRTRPQVISMNDVIPPLLLEIGVQILGDAINIDHVMDKDLCKVKVDINEFKIAIMNMAVNSKEAMPKGGKFQIIVSNDATIEQCRMYLRIQVSDTGNGIHAQNISKVFEPFFTTKDVGCGSGLGLSHVYGFVKQSDGHIEISSVVDEGTVISICLPEASEQPYDNTAIKQA